MDTGDERDNAGILRVLLVEDSLEDTALLLDELRNTGLVVEHTRVDSADRLRAALTDARWQLVLCDYALPTFDALAALEIARELRCDAPFIVVSGAVGEEAAVQAMKAGAHDFVRKDRLARLGPAIERSLREVAVRKESLAFREQLLLSDRLVQIGTLAAGVAHEINNPLAYVLGNLAHALKQLATLEGSAEIRDAVAGALQKAMEGAERIRTTTEDLRVFSRIDDGKPHPVELRRVLDSAIGMAWTQIRHRARLIKNFEVVPPVCANENRLGQVFLNLLINAAQAIPEGNVAQHEIRVSMRQIGAAVEVEVSDTGLGVASQMRSRLFEPFFTTKPKDVGTGLGLSISRQIVREYDGEIDAQANPERGMTFRVRLPIGAAQAARASSPVPSGRALRSGRVMLIDDEVALVDILTRLLSVEHEVVGFTDARQALVHLANDSEFDIVLCDLMMPQLSSSEFFAELRASAPELVERVVFMTGGAFTSAAQQFLESVSNLRLQKPFPPGELARVVREFVARREIEGHTPAAVA